MRLNNPSLATHPDLAQLEQHLFTSTRAKDTTPAKIVLKEAADRRTEVKALVRQIVKMTRNTKAPLRYRDIAIIVRDLDAYHDLLASTLTEQSIPFFIDRRYSLAHHALVELLRSAIALVEEDFSPRAVRSLLKTGLLGIEQERLDRLENYLLAHRIKGAQALLSR